MLKEVNKRGQVTIFIILGIIILTGIILFLALKDKIIKSSLKTEQEQQLSSLQLEEPVQNYVESCLKKVGEDALIYVGNHGGYYEPPLIWDTQLYLPYYFYENKINLISEEELQQELGIYINNQIPFCLQNFAYFKDKGYEINSGQINTQVNIFPESVKFNMQLPLNLAQGIVSKDISIFKIIIPVRLGIIYSAIKKFTLQQNNDPESFCITCIYKIASTNNLKVENNFIEQKGAMITFIDEIILVKNQPYKFNFLNQYTFMQDEE